MSSDNKALCLFDFEDIKTLVISRIDGNRGPLGVAKALIDQFKLRSDYISREYGGPFSLVRAIFAIPFRYEGHSICIHANGYKIPALLYFASLIDMRNKYYCVMHGIARIESSYRPIKQSVIILERFIFRHFSNIICVSDFQRQELFKLYGSRENVHIIGNGVDVSQFIGDEDDISYPLSTKQVTAITTGGYESRKGTDLAIEVLVQLRRICGINIKMIVCGRDGIEVGSNRELCEALAKDGGIDLEYFGEVEDKSNLIKLYKSCDFYFGLSRFDTFNVSVLEGAAARCIPVISNMCGAYNLFDVDSSVQCDIESKEWINIATLKLARICNDSSRFKMMSLSAYQIASNSSWAQIAQQYCILFEDK